MSRSAEGAVGSIRRLGRPAALPASPLAPARSSLPATARPSSQPPRESHRSLLPPPLLPRAGCAFPRSCPERLRSERPPSLRPPPHRRGGRGTCPRPFRPRPHLPPTPDSRIPLPPIRCPKGAPRAPNLTASGIPAALPSWPGPPFRPAPVERPPSLRPARPSARPAPASRPGRPAAGGNLPDSHSARPPVLPAPYGPPARPSGLRPALSAARGTPLSSGGPTCD